MLKYKYIYFFSIAKYIKIVNYILYSLLNNYLNLNNINKFKFYCFIYVLKHKFLIIFLSIFSVSVFFPIVDNTFAT